MTVETASIDVVFFFFGGGGGAISRNDSDGYENVFSKVKSRCCLRLRYSSSDGKEMYKKR